MNRADPPPVTTTIGSDRMAVLFAVMLVTASGNTAMQSVLPTLGTQLKIPDFWVSLAFSWSALLWVYMAPRWARVADRRGRKALMNLGMIGFSSSMLFAGAALYFGLNGWYTPLATFVLFAIFRSLYGGLGSAAPPAVQAYVAARTARADRTKALSLIASSFGLGTIVGPAVAPLLMIPFFGLASPMFVFAGIGLVVMAALAWRLPNDDPRFAARGVVTNEPYSSAAAGNIKRDEEGDDDEEDDTDPPPLAWLDPRTRNWLMTGFLGGSAHAMVLGVIGFLVLDRMGLRTDPAAGVEMTGIALMSGAAATLLAQWGLIPLLHLGPRACVLWGMVLAAAGCAILSEAGGLYAIILGFGLASLGFGMFRPGFTSGSSLVVRRSEQNAVAGMVASVNGATYIASPAIGVLLYTWFAPLPFWLALAICMFLLGWGWKVLQGDAETVER